MRHLFILLISATLFACAGADKDETAGYSAKELYEEAQSAIDSAEFQTAVKHLESLEARYPFDPYAKQAQLDIAYAYSRVGNVERFDEAMERSRTGMDTLAELGFDNSYLDFINAVHAALAGDHDSAINRLTTAVDRGYLTAGKFSNGWEALAALEGDPQYEALQTRVLDHVNQERAELGLEPMSI